MQGSSKVQGMAFEIKNGRRKASNARASLGNPHLVSSFEAESIRRIVEGEMQLFRDLSRPCERAMYLMLMEMLGNEAEVAVYEPPSRST